MSDLTPAVVSRPPTLPQGRRAENLDRWETERCDANVHRRNLRSV